MEGEKEGRGGVMKNLSFPRDLLQRFTCSSSSSRSSNVVQDVRNTAFRGDEEEEEDPEELELSLGLSLGGRFGTDRSKKNNLVRSSSIIGTVPFARDISFGGGGGGDDSSSPAPAMSYPMLMRTSSLPVETEEEWRKRKEIQTMRRMAAKRRRSAKQRNSAGVGGKATEREDEVSAGVAASPSVSRQNTIGGGVDLAADVAVAVAARSRQLNSQASAESPVGSSSGISELDNRVGQGSSSYGETRSPAGHQMSMERSLDSTGPAGPPGIKTAESKCSTSGSKADPGPGPGPGGSKGREIGTNAVEDMPCVFTKGDGPNGRRVDGILYRYGKGEEVRIMCVCHGKFLSPAEFVKHAGGGDVDNPLRHIVINPSSASFL